MELLIATTNPHKVKELERILGEQGFRVLGLGDFGPATEVVETGVTFAENALIKARHYFGFAQVPTVADDSGLEVAALGGAPGVRSARYAGASAADSDQISKLLGELAGVQPEQRQARFVCAAAIVWDRGEKVFTGEVLGRILSGPIGQAGFGYDPVFYYAPLGKTFAQLTPEEKSKVSHRGIAFRRLASWLKGAGLASG